MLPLTHAQSPPGSHGAGLVRHQLCPAPQEHAASLDRKGGSLLRLQWCRLRGQKQRKFGMPADFNGKKPWLSSPSPTDGCSRLSAVPEGSSPPAMGLCTLRTLGCVQPWRLDSLMLRVRPVQSYTTSQWASMQGQLMPVSSGQVNALRILVFTCVLILEMPALPMNCTGARAPGIMGVQQQDPSAHQSHMHCTHPPLSPAKMGLGQ